MEILNVPKLEFSSKNPDLKEISDRLDNLKENKIAVLNWAAFGYRPFVNFSIAYSSDEILLKYRVKEDYLLAENTESNQNVWEDSCVEFFFSLDDTGVYYNFEFNAIGTCLVGFGKNRNNRTLLDPLVIERIRRFPSLGKEPIHIELTGPISWELTLAIPFSLFVDHKIISFAGKKLRANFNKCGDKLSVPHFLTWNPVNTENPDFHRPEFFGELLFL